MGVDTVFETYAGMLYWWEKIWLHGEYDLPTDKPVKTVVDIGACHGAFAVWAARRWNPDVIHCYEPSSDAFDKLVTNTADLRVQNTRAAVLDGDAGPTMTLSLSPSNVGASSLHLDRSLPEYAALDTEEVPIVPAWQLPDCDLLKLDCEGSELRILSDYLMYKSGKNPYVVVLEYHSLDLAYDVQQLMFRLGYLLWGCYPSTDLDPGGGLGIMKWRLDR